MKGYFSRLIQQTGITIAGAPGQSFVRQDAAVTPIHAEEERIIDHPAEITEGKNSGDSTDSRRISSQISENEDIQQPIEERLKSRLSQEPEKQEPESSTHISKNRDVQQPIEERHRNTLYARNAQSQAERARSQPEVNGLPGSEVEILHERQPNLKEIREWVAGTPFVDSGEIKSRAAIETMETEKKVYSEGDIFTPSYPEQRPELHDLHLSIGTISMIIEEPQKKEQRKEPTQTIKVENRSVRETETSRLSRHYIRTG